MAKVLISLADEKVRETVIAALSATKHEAVVMEPLDPGLELLDMAEKIMAAKGGRVIVMDYWTDDALSVKLMQDVLDQAQQPPDFIFIEGKVKVALEQVHMALNEGARAFMPQGFNPDALVSYVEKAISGPGRLRFSGRLTNGEAAVARLEEALGEQRIRTASFQKLVSRLLSTPAASQHRKALLVFDSPYQLELLKKFLEEHNFTTLTAANPVDGLALALAEKPRIVVSNLEFEGQTGIEFCQALKFTNKFVPCYFIVCTSNKEKIAKVMVPGNGVDDCIIKPSGQNDQIDFVSRVALGLLL